MDPKLLSATEIKNKDFKKSAWGFSPKEVGEFLDQMAFTWEAFLKREKEHTDKIQTLHDELVRWKGREQELVRTKQNAIEEVSKIKEEAKAEAQKHFSEMEQRAVEIRQRTEEWLENIIAEVEETERQRHNFVTAFRSALDSHYALLNGSETTQESLGQKLNQFLRSTRATQAADSRFEANRPTAPNH